MAIVDNRILLTNADATTGWVNVAGTSAGSTDTDTAIEGSPPTSITFNLSNTVQGLLYDLGGSTDISSNHVYVWANVGIAGLLATETAGGLRFRFCGTTITDFFEVYIAGSDTYTGGWKMFVIDVDDASANPDNTGGTPPAASAIQYLGVVGDTGGTMTKKQDNFWVDAMWRLPNTEPGIKVEGENGAGDPWTWADILAESTGSAWGTCQAGPGGSIVINTPIQFGITGSVSQSFSDTNQIILWDNQPVSASFYGFTIIGNTNDQTFVAGQVDGTGDDAAGTQGWVVAADPAGQRWNIVAQEDTIDNAQFLGCTFFHNDNILINTASAEMISTQLLDTSFIRPDNANFLKNLVVDANTVAGDALIRTTTPEDIRYSTFNYSAGHAIELTPEITTPVTFSLAGNTFSNYTGDDTSGSAIFNNTGGDVLLIITNGGSTPTVRNSFGSSTDVQNPVVLTITNIVSGSEVRILSSSNVFPPIELGGTEESGTSFAYNYQFVAAQFVDIVVLDIDYKYYRLSNFELGATDQSIPIQQEIDRVYLNP